MKPPGVLRRYTASFSQLPHALLRLAARTEMVRRAFPNHPDEAGAILDGTRDWTGS